MDTMSCDAINLLLETFKECARRGNQATLFLETRNGQQFGTLRLRTPDFKSKPTSTLRNQQKDRKKSPSTVRRDQQRLRTFLQNKSAQESLGRPSATSTPTINRAKTDSSSQVAEKSGTVAKDKPANESGMEYQETNDETKSDSDTEKAGIQIDWKEIDKMINRNVTKFNKEANEIFGSLLSDATGNKQENDLNDNLEEAKVWAKNQKKSF